MNIDEYFNLDEQEKIKFYNDICNNNKQIQSNNFYTFIPKRKEISPMEIGTHQKTGRLQFISKLKKDNDKHIYCLCLCDCGNYYITRLDNFKRESSNGGALSCGCLNNEQRKNFLNSEESNKRKYEALINRYEKENKTIHPGDNIKGWNITKTKMFTIGSKNRKYVKGYCPLCGNESNWIRLDGITRGAVQTCGCNLETKSLSEIKIAKLLKENNIFFNSEITFSDCVNLKTNKKLRFDFGIYEDKEKTKLLYIIEYDGEQHFICGFGNNKEDLKNYKKRDKIKNEYCKNNNIPLIRISCYDKNSNEITIEDLKLETTKFIFKE